MKKMPDKIASTVGYGTSGGLIFWGGFVKFVHNLDWNQVAIISGIVIGIATFVVNVWYKRQTLKAYKEALSRGIIAPPAQDE